MLQLTEHDLGYTENSIYYFPNGKKIVCNNNRIIFNDVISLKKFLILQVGVFELEVENIYGETVNSKLKLISEKIL